MDIRQTPERRLIMTLALHKALEVLQMPQLELSQWLQGEIEKNPLLEFNTPRSCPAFDPEIASTLTLHEHLLSQIRESFSSEQDQKRAEEMVECLDERGFLICPEEKIDAKVLSILQTFDPPGIFARNLREAFLIQLTGKEKTLAYLLVQNCFEDLLHGRYSAIKKKLGHQDLSSALQILARLSTRPAKAYSQDPITFALPDLKIAKVEGGWTLEVNEDELPQFHIRTDYCDLELESEEEKESLREFKTQAKWISRSLDRRRKLLRDIGRILIRKQSLFLDQKGPLSPITMKELAEKLHIHESTLSRALSGKYISTPRGIIPMRSLISATPETENAKETLQKLVQMEDKANPLTDDQLATALKTKGFPVARRTISKYRTQLKIGSATRRKHLPK